RPVVLGEPDALEAEALRVLDLLEHLVVRALVVPVGAFEHVEERELHRCLRLVAGVRAGAVRIRDPAYDAAARPSGRSRGSLCAELQGSASAAAPEATSASISAAET